MLVYFFLQWLQIYFITWYFDANENLFPGNEGEKVQ